MASYAVLLGGPSDTLSYSSESGVIPPAEVIPSGYDVLQEIKSTDVPSWTGIGGDSTTANLVCDRTTHVVSWKTSNSIPNSTT